MKTGLAFVIRLLARVVLAVYLGGFTFYASVVVPDLHDHLGGMETGEISRRVAVVLYALGASAIGLGWLLLLIDRPSQSGRRTSVQFALLLLNTLLLVGIVAMHRQLAIDLDSGRDLNAFRSFHEKYLTVWTGHWLALLGLMAADTWGLRPVLTDRSGHSRDAVAGS